MAVWTEGKLSTLRKEFPICKSVAALAGKLGHTTNAVRQKAMKLGLNRNKQNGIARKSRSRKQAKARK